jgi:hypothetical protein
MMFVGTMVIFFLIVRRWPVPPEEPVAAEVPPKSGAVSWQGAALAVVGLLFAPAWLVADNNTMPLEQLPRLLPGTIESWSTEPSEQSDWLPIFAGADVTQRTSYSQAGNTVEGYAALYADQQQGKELADFNNSVTGAALSIRGRSSSAGQGPWLELEAADSRGERWLLWYAYRLDEDWHHKALPMQLQYGMRSLISAPLSAVVAFRARCLGEECSAAREALRAVAASTASSDGR